MRRREAYVARLVKNGVIALKMHQTYTRPIEFDEVPKEVAKRDFPRPDDPGPTPKTVQDYMADQICRLGAEYDESPSLSFRTISRSSEKRFGSL